VRLDLRENGTVSHANRSQTKGTGIRVEVDAGLAAGIQFKAYDRDAFLPTHLRVPSRLRKAFSGLGSLRRDHCERDYVRHFHLTSVGWQ